MYIYVLDTNHFNPLPPHGGRPIAPTTGTQIRWISIHSLRMEGDSGSRHALKQRGISIHSLRMEGDLQAARTPLQGQYFNPLPPHGGRLFCAENNFSPMSFQSTPSAWRETERTMEEVAVTSDFNPLPPHGGRRAFPFPQLVPPYFNPLPPHGGRPTLSTHSPIFSPFQSTPSAWRET